jgi:hypothetical protein
LLAFLDQVVARGFLDAPHRSMILTASDPNELLQQFESYRPATADKAAWALEQGHV